MLLSPAPLTVPSALEAENAAQRAGVPATNGIWSMGTESYLRDQFSFPSSGSYTFTVSDRDDQRSER